jgi:hypothetical protein
VRGVEVSFLIAKCGCVTSENCQRTIFRARVINALSVDVLVWIPNVDSHRPGPSRLDSIAAMIAYDYFAHDAFSTGIPAKGHEVSPLQILLHWSSVIS